MAEQTSGEITIDASPQQVIDVITDFEAYPEWAGMVKTVEVKEKDDQGRGKVVRFEASAVGLSGWYELSYDFSAGEGGVSWDFVDGSPIKDLAGVYELRPEGGGTHVTYRASVDPGVPMIGFMKRKVEGMIINTALKGLKKRVESLG